MGREWDDDRRKDARDDYRGPERRRYESGNGNGGWLSGVPGWVRGIAIVGIPGAIAIFLVWMGAQEVPKLSRQVQVNHETMTKIQEMMREHQQQTEALSRMLQRICSNTARTEDDRQRCFDR